ncbi:hypothetical protein [Yunchengibacter salinarum]|uniref:hypothetical protein n=1 Tax=Yunchengibacter salinarum TaxID=3133399 RepID=UPI0035B64735
MKSIKGFKRDGGPLRAALLGVSALALAACAGDPDRPLNADSRITPAEQANQVARTSAGQDFGMESILSGDWQRAETALTASGNDGAEPFRLLNLAYIYRRTGRPEQAATLYRQILDGEANPLAEMPGGEPAPVKDVARRGLAALDLTR